MARWLQGPQPKRDAAGVGEGDPDRPTCCDSRWLPLEDFVSDLHGKYGQLLMRDIERSRLLTWPRRFCPLLGAALALPGTVRMRRGWR